MAAPTPADWQTTLDRMDEVLRTSTRALDRTEERWEIALAPSAGEGELPVALARNDERLREWEARLRAAEELAAAVEAEAADRAAAVEAWRAAFARWGELIERRGQSSPGS